MCKCDEQNCEKCKHYDNMEGDRRFICVKAESDICKEDADVLPIICKYYAEREPPEPSEFEKFRQANECHRRYELTKDEWGYILCLGWRAALKAAMKTVEGKAYTVGVIDAMRKLDAKEQG